MSSFAKKRICTVFIVIIAIAYMLSVGSYTVRNLEDVYSMDTVESIAAIWLSAIADTFASGVVVFLVVAAEKLFFPSVDKRDALRAKKNIISVLVAIVFVTSIISKDVIYGFWNNIPNVDSDFLSDVAGGRVIFRNHFLCLMIVILIRNLITLFDMTSNKGNVYQSAYENYESHYTNNKNFDRYDNSKYTQTVETKIEYTDEEDEYYDVEEEEKSTVFKVALWFSIICIIVLACFVIYLYTKYN